MRILVSGGGTGGHVYPILTVVEALKKAAPPPSPAADIDLEPLTIRYAGTPDGIEATLVPAAGIDFAPIPAGQVRIRNPFKLARSGVRLTQGFLAARRLVQQWRPHVLFVTGGYVCAPVVWAAHRGHVPILIYLPDMIPGLAIRRLSRYAAKVAVSFPAVAAHFPGKALVTGYPVRAALLQQPYTPAEARTLLGLHPQRPTLLVFGGSRGARSLNVALANILPQLLKEAQVIHITGTFDWPQAQKRVANLTPAQRQRYRSFPYLDELLPAAFFAADLAVARAGAATLGELPAVGLPAILVPLPISGGHQYPNARYLAEHGAAEILEDAALSSQLLPTIQALLQHPDRLQAMSDASRALARPDAAAHIAAAILELGQNSTHAAP